MNLCIDGFDALAVNRVWDICGGVCGPNGRSNNIGLLPSCTAEKKVSGVLCRGMYAHSFLIVEHIDK